MTYVASLIYKIILLKECALTPFYRDDAPHHTRKNLRPCSTSRFIRAGIAITLRCSSSEHSRVSSFPTTSTDRLTTRKIRGRLVRRASAASRHTKTALQTPSFKCFVNCLIQFCSRYLGITISRVAIIVIVA